jgi:hypothetical protein
MDAYSLTTGGYFLFKVRRVEARIGSYFRLAGGVPHLNSAKSSLFTTLFLACYAVAAIIASFGRLFETA